MAHLHKPQNFDAGKKGSRKMCFRNDLCMRVFANAEEQRRHHYEDSTCVGLQNTIKKTQEWQNKVPVPSDIKEPEIIYEDDAESFAFRRRKKSDITKEMLKNLCPYEGNEGVVMDAMDQLLQQNKQRRKLQMVSEFPNQLPNFRTDYFTGDTI